MKLTEQHREALRLARVRIVNGDNSMICYALLEVGNRRQELRPACYALKAEIAAFLAPNCMLEQWQRVNGWPIRYCRADRLAWIDWMLEQNEL